ncbi:MAG: Unknown protein [uncultured Sulfurovum sp.]|uniref:Integral membrane protein Cj1412c n=1 Tax=uncultured Sulfurovum sp. TaxID=269237 RepID=A0A6S6S888_9BACT|nr:MAG: Unknown protein [uncultured Sulfurovum sp.]
MNHNVENREAFYLGGYDPRGVRYYYNLYKTEATKQTKSSDINISVGKRKRSNMHVHTWEINTQTDTIQTKTNYHFLEWDDIIREDWKKNVLELFLDFIFYFKTYILAGRFSQYMFSSPYQMVGIFLPLFYVIISFFLVTFLSTQIYLYFEGLVGLAIYLGTFILMFSALIKLGDKLAVFWLLRIFVFSARYAFHEKKNLDLRLNEFSAFIEKRIETAKENNIDEILLVSHSVGSILSIPLLEKILKKTEHNQSDVKLSVLVLGECIPLVSGINHALEYKSKMQFVAQSTNLFWLDYTTVIDGACFPQLNYFEDANIQIKEKESFHFHTGRFHTLFSKKTYKQLRKNKYLTHFIYFMATEISGNYNFFKMTAGSKKLNTVVKENIQ